MKGQSYDPPTAVQGLVTTFNEDQEFIAKAIHAILREIKELDDENPKPSLTGLGQIIKDVTTLLAHTPMTYIPTSHVCVSKADMILNV